MNCNYISAWLCGWLVFAIGLTVRSHDGIFPLFANLVDGVIVSAIVVAVGSVVCRYFQFRIPRSASALFFVRGVCLLLIIFGVSILIFPLKIEFLTETSPVFIDELPTGLFEKTVKIEIAIISYFLAVYGVLFFPVRQSQ